MTDPDSAVSFSEDRERMASMLENWFQQRMSLSNRAFRFMFIPLIAVVVFALLFWFNYYIPVPSVFLLGALGVALLVWLVFLLMGAGILRKVRTGDSIMLRKIRSADKSKEA